MTKIYSMPNNTFLEDTWQLYWHNFYKYHDSIPLITVSISSILVMHSMHNFNDSKIANTNDKYLIHSL